MSESKKKKGGLGIWTPVVILAAVAFIVGFFSVSTANQHKSELDQAQQTIYSLQSEKAVAQAAQKQDKQRIGDNAVGIDSSRKSKDDKIAEKFIQSFSGWDNYNSYRAKREAVMKTYGMNDKSQFMSSFMPDVAPSNKTTKNSIDAGGLSSKYVAMKSYATGVENKVYSYFTVVTLNGTDAHGNHADGHCALTYDIAPDGKIENIKGYALAQ